jgi:uncharacterized protein YdeI (YjbR/CyaY-like superfamily)
MRPTFFTTPAELRAWFDKHHDTAKELWVGFYKKGSGRQGITWRDSVDEALCFGWIDGVRKSIDDSSYTNRFTPRTPRSNWSAVNIGRVEELKRAGRMRLPGLAAFERRSEERSGVYSYGQRHYAKLDRAQQKRFRENEKAWDFFAAQPAWYRQAAIWWVISAKRDETKAKRLDQLIEHSAHGRTIGPLTRRRANPTPVPRAGPSSRIRCDPSHPRRFAEGQPGGRPSRASALAAPPSPAPGLRPSAVSAP